jgi:undecaprenyl-diphosphatase
MDQSITRWLNAQAGNNLLLDWLIIAVTQFGVPLLVLLVVVQWWGKSERIHVRHVCVAAGLSFLVGLCVNQVILLFLHRLRPYDADISHLIISGSSDWSFPSDHATAVFSIAASFLLHGFGRRGLAFLVAALVVCVSRVYVGTHYVSDVLGGASTGLVAAGVIRFLYWESTRADRIVTGIL